MGTTPEDGVIDARNRVFGYENLYVVDGSMIPANLGVNPSLTITAMAEHAMSHVSLKDPREGLRHLPVQARAAGERPQVTPAEEISGVQVQAERVQGRTVSVPSRSVSLR